MVMIGWVFAKLMKLLLNVTSAQPETLHEEIVSGQKNETYSILKE
jgi:hypothetical protein